MQIKSYCRSILIVFNWNFNWNEILWYVLITYKNNRISSFCIFKIKAILNYYTLNIIIKYYDFKYYFIYSNHFMKVSY